MIDSLKALLKPSEEWAWAAVPFENARFQKNIAGLGDNPTIANSGLQSDENQKAGKSVRLKPISPPGLIDNWVACFIRARRTHAATPFQGVTPIHRTVGSCLTEVMAPRRHGDHRDLQTAGRKKANNKKSTWSVISCEFRQGAQRLRDMHDAIVHVGLFHVVIRAIPAMTVSLLFIAKARKGENAK
jgi:hypothetical protein